MPNIAVVLAGCGRSDGSEITEAVSCLIHLDRLGATHRCFAPDKPQSGVVNHVTNQPAAETRNQMVEAARIARGEIAPLATLDVDAFDAAVFPGGYGAAKNLCSFASAGADCAVEPDAERVIRGFHAAAKPIGLCCIAPVIAARVLGTASGGPGVSVTIGSDRATAAAIEKMGSANVPMGVTEAHVDHANRIATTPAYMCDAGPHDVYTGIGRMIEATLGLIGR